MANFNYGSLMFFTQLSSSATLATSAASVIYANPASYKTYVNEIEIHNTLNSITTVIVYLVPNNSGSLGTVTTFNEFTRITLQAYDTVYIQPRSPYVLSNTNDAIYGVASSSGINVQARGMIYS